MELINLEIDDISLITEKIKYRQEHFEEDLGMSVGVVLMNYGDHLVDVKCINGEWSGKKKNLSVTDGIPKCPNGHVLFELSVAPRLALVID